MRRAFLLLALASCGGKSKEPPPAGNRPASVLATITVAPGFSAPTQDWLAKAGANVAPLIEVLKVVDAQPAYVDKAGAPITVYLVDRGQGIELAFAGARAAGVAIPEGEADASDQRVIRGSRPTLDAIAAWALSAPPPTPAADELAAVVFVPDLVRLHGGHFDRFRAALPKELAPKDPPLAKLWTLAGDALSAAAGDTTEIDVSIHVPKAFLSIDAAIVAVGGSRLATFASAQTPDDFALVPKLKLWAPIGPPLVVAGHLAAGPYAAPMHDALVAAYAFLAAAADPAAVDAVAKLSAGHTALAWRPSPLLTQLVATTDVKAAAAAAKGADTAELDGGVLALAAGDESKVGIAELVEAARGPAPDLKSYDVQLFDHARVEGDSLAAVVDVPRFEPISVPPTPPSGFLVGIGAASGTLHVRISIPPIAIHTLLP